MDIFSYNNIVLNFITFTYLILFLEYEVDYFDQMLNIMITFILYIIFSFLFKFYDFIILRKDKSNGYEILSAKKLQTINRRMFIIGAAKVIVFTGIISKIIFIANI